MRRPKHPPTAGGSRRAQDRVAGAQRHGQKRPPQSPTSTGLFQANRSASGRRLPARPNKSGRLPPWQPGRTATPPMASRPVPPYGRATSGTEGSIHSTQRPVPPRWRRTVFQTNDAPAGTSQGPPAKDAPAKSSSTTRASAPEHKSTRKDKAPACSTGPEKASHNNCRGSTAANARAARNPANNTLPDS